MFNGKTAWSERIPDAENKQEQIKYMLTKTALAARIAFMKKVFKSDN